MTPDRAGAILGVLGPLVLVVSALVVRQRPIVRSKLMAMGVIWIAVFALLFIAARWIDAGR